MAYPEGFSAPSADALDMANNSDDENEYLLYVEKNIWEKNQLISTLFPKKVWQFRFVCVLILKVCVRYNVSFPQPEGEEGPEQSQNRKSASKKGKIVGANMNNQQVF